MNPLTRLHKRSFAFVVARWSDDHAEMLRPHKQKLLGELSGRVLEIGPGGGNNLRFLSGRDVDWVGLEPNPYFEPYIAEEAERTGVRTEILPASAEAIPLEDGSVDAAVSTLVLCSVPDVETVLGELLRVLKPGGKLVFVEHVVARPGERHHLLQRMLDPFWAWFADGCRLRRDLEASIRAAGFAEVDCERFLLPVPLVSPTIAGTAVKAS